MYRPSGENAASTLRSLIGPSRKSMRPECRSHKPGPPSPIDRNVFFSGETIALWIAKSDHPCWDLVRAVLIAAAASEAPTIQQVLRSIWRHVCLTQQPSISCHRNIWLIYLGAVGPEFWLDLFYGIAVAGLLPQLIIKSFA